MCVCCEPFRSINYRDYTLTLVFRQHILLLTELSKETSMNAAYCHSIKGVISLVSQLPVIQPLILLIITHPFPPDRWLLK